MDLFERNAQEYYRRHAPLAERLRPRGFEELFGQDELVGEGRYLRRMVESDRLASLILWGPPGTGKTTLARIVARATGRRFVSISAVTSGVAEVKKIIDDAARALRFEQRGTILFIDEIHRFNKAQQDALLHAVERGTLTLIGATTENPSFEVIGALLSRLQVLVLKPLGPEPLRAILARALRDQEHGLGAAGLVLTPEAAQALVALAAGDGRALLNFLELAALLANSRNETEVTAETVREAAGRRTILYDKTGEEHYNVVSAFIKSMRGSDPDAALYYLARMIEGGEDPEFIARRLIIFASEDVGNADPEALRLAVACRAAVAHIGMPEGFYPLSQCAVYLAAAPKSNASGAAYLRAVEAVREHGPLAVPLHLRNAPTELMRDLGYGRDYKYPHDYEGGHVAEDYLPEPLRGRRFYEPTDRGLERRLARRLRSLRARRSEVANADAAPGRQPVPSDEKR
jgi:putative ATPase